MARQDDTPAPRAIQELADVVAQFRTAMLVNANDDGRMRARPMTIANRDADAPRPAAPGGQAPQRVSFVTRRSNELVDDLRADPSVCITLQDGAKYACLAGRARLDQDRERLRALWNPAFDLWFRGGPDDPETVLIDCDMPCALVRGRHRPRRRAPARRDGSREARRRPGGLATARPTRGGRSFACCSDLRHGCARAAGSC